MFGKLMNYELRYLLRIFAPLWGAILLLCTLTRLTFGFSGDGYTSFEGKTAVLAALLIFLTMLALFSAAIIVITVVLQRFYKGVFGDEGYLLFTLPVTTGQIINAKAISAVLMSVITGAVTIVGMLIISSHFEDWDMLSIWLGSFMYDYDISGAYVAVMIFWAIVEVILAVAQFLYQIYFAMTIGQLWKKHPIAGAILAFYGVQMVVSGIGFGGASLLGGTPVEVLMNGLMNITGGTTKVLAVMAYLIVRSLILIIIYYFGTKLILDKKLEL